MANLLKKLAQYCDTGFALAIHIRYTRPSLLFQTYDQAWNDYYSENGLMLSDPVVRWGLQNTGYVLWDDLMDDDDAGVLAKAKSFGLNNGVTYATGPISSRTISGFTRNGPPFSKEELDAMNAIVDEVHELTQGIENFSEEEINALREIDLSEY
ncbi:autoinducer binding domain-containing protein [Actibacterium lipolyticum]|nr:autoinducer binding domain-containing protein [Actibacterium lipolyticum]